MQRLRTLGQEPRSTQHISEGLFDTSSIGLIGFSFGAYLAPRVASRCPDVVARVASGCPDVVACVSLGGCVDLSFWGDLPPLLKGDLGYFVRSLLASGGSGAGVDKCNAAEAIPHVSGRLLAVHSTNDRIFPHTEAWKVKELKADTDVVIYEGGEPLLSQSIASREALDRRLAPRRLTN